MSKNKDFEKKLEKEIEKIKPEKEHIKIEKLEKHEHKDYKEPIKEKSWRSRKSPSLSARKRKSSKRAGRS